MVSFFSELYFMVKQTRNFYISFNERIFRRRTIMFENKAINGYIYETRFIASWINVGGQLRYLNDIDNFHKWLLSLGLTKDEADHIKMLATNGKLELETSARKFLNDSAK